MHEFGLVNAVSGSDFLHFVRVPRRIAISEIDRSDDVLPRTNRNGIETDAATTFDINGPTRFDGNFRGIGPTRLVAKPLSALQRFLIIFF